MPDVTVRALRAALFVLTLVGMGVLTAGCGPPCSDVTLYMINPDGTDGHRVDIKGDVNPWQPFWLPGARRIGFLGCWSVKADGSDLRERTPPKPKLVDGVMISAGCKFTRSNRSPDGLYRAVKA